MSTPEQISAIVHSVNASRPAEQHVSYLGATPFGQGIRLDRFSLPNGLMVLIEVDASAPVVSLQTWMRVGSRFEKPGKTGISHLFEHLMFGETEEHAHGAFDRMLEEAGGDTNAATFLDWTYYHQNLPRDAVPLGLRLEAVRLHKLVLREQQVASEKEVVANERRQRVDDDVDGAVSEILYREAYKEHAYGIPTIGWMEDIQGFTPEDCLDFYRTYYAPNNATLVLVGDVDLESILGVIADQFGPLLRSEIPPEDVHPEPPQVEERRVVVEKPTMTDRLAIGFKGPSLGDFDHAPLVILNEILFGGRSSRLHRRLVKELELATLQSLEAVSGRAETIGFYETVLGEPGALFTKLDAYRRVSVSDALRVARRFLSKSARTVIEVHPSPEADDDEGDDASEEVAA